MTVSPKLSQKYQVLEYATGFVHTLYRLADRAVPIILTYEGALLWYGM